MKARASFKLTLLIIGLLCSGKSVIAQAPTYQLTISNETQINDRTYQFDVYLKNTSANTFELANISFGIAYDTSILMGGTPTCSIVSGFSDLNAAQVPSAGSTITGNILYTISINGTNVVCRYLNISPRSNPGAGSGSIISSIGSCPNRGTRICRLQIANTVPFRGSSTCKHAFSSGAGTQKTNTVVSAYVAGIATSISSQTSHLAYATTTTASSTSYTSASATGTCSQNIVLNCPTAGTLSGTQIICSNGTSTFTSTVAGGTWSSDNTAVATIDASTGVITAVTVGTATMTYTIASSGTCSAATATRTVSVNALSNAGTLSGTNVVCSNSSTTFTSTVSGGSWSSSDTSIANINASTGVITPVATGTATMSYTVTGTGGCSNATATREVIINAGPVAGTLSGTQSICTNGGTSTTTFTSSSAGGTWSSGNTSVATIDANTGVITPVAAGTATMTYTVTFSGCPDATATRTVTVTAAPSAGILSGTQTVCTNSTGISFSSSVSGGYWISSDTTIAFFNGMINGTINIISVGVTTMTYTVTGTGGCSNATATRNLFVTQGPVSGTLSGTTAICSNGGTSTTSFTSTYPGGTWSSGNLSVATINPSTGVITPLAAGTAVMTYSVSAAGCPDATATRTVNVTNAPSAGTLSGTQNICSSTSTTFTTTATGGAWSSSNTSVATVNTTSGLVSGLSPGSSTLTYTVLGTGGCANATASRVLTITAPPSAGTLSGRTSICISGDTSTTTYTSTISGGTWTSGTPSVATINFSSGVITPISTGTVTMNYTVTGTGGCNNVTATRTLFVYAPQSTGTLSGNQFICANGGIRNTIFSSTVSGGVWTSDDTMVARINLTTGLITSVAAGIANMTYIKSGIGGCTNTIATRMVTVTKQSAGTLSGNQFICDNGGINFTNLSSTVAGGTWTSASPNIATVDTLGLVHAIAPGLAVINYKVIGTGGCNDTSETRTVSVTAAPSAGILSGTTSLCSNGSTTLTSTVTGGNWSSSNTNVATVNTTSGVVTAVAAGTSVISYTFLGTGGCNNATSTIIVIVTNAANAGILSGINVICSNSNSTFVSTINGGTWSSDNTSVATINSTTGVVTAVAAGSATMTYTVLGTGGCSNSIAQRTVTVTAAPNAGTISGTTAICSNSSTSLTSNGNSGGTWSSSNSAAATINSTSGIVTGVSAGIVTMTYTIVATGGCTSNSIATFVISVTAAPNAGTLSGNQNICSNQTTMFASTSSSGSWSSGNTNVATINSTTGLITGIAAGASTITYTAVGTGGCNNDIATRIVAVTAAPTSGTISGASTICSNQIKTLSSSITGGTWSSSNTLILAVNSTTGVITPISPGSATITYTVLGTGGCANASTSKVITVNNVYYNSYSVSSCSYYLLPWNGDTVRTGGNYSFTYSSTSGCDSIVNLNITINNPVAGTSFNASGFGTYTLPWGQIVTNSGYYSYAYQNVYGCDSLVTAYVVIEFPADSTRKNIGVNVENPQRNLHIKNVLRIEPRNTPPTNPSKGDIYFDGTTDKLRIFDGRVWRDAY
jgi:uncharacterized protein YjdB